MPWHAFRLTLRLLSPLHVGFHKVGNLQRTRPYVPGRNIWAATTARLTRHIAPGDYQAVGELIAEHCIFGYFFPAVQVDVPLYPVYHAEGLSYGPMDNAIPPDEFEHQLISSYASTALDYDRWSAIEGSLHEVERLSAYTPTGQAVFLVGHVFVRPDEVPSGTDGSRLRYRFTLDPAFDAPVRIVGEGHNHPAFQTLFEGIQVGGERGYGYGRLRLEDGREVSDVFGLPFDGSDPLPTIIVGPGRPFPEHALVEKLDGVRGQIEPLVGRSTAADGNFGRTLTPVQVCWVPGSCPSREVTVEVRSNGILQSR